MDIGLRLCPFVAGLTLVAGSAFAQGPTRRELRWRWSHAPPMSRRDGGIDLADRLLPAQLTEISCYSAD